MQFDEVRLICMLKGKVKSIVTSQSKRFEHAMVFIFTNGKT